MLNYEELLNIHISKTYAMYACIMYLKKKKLSYILKAKVFLFAWLKNIKNDIQKLYINIHNTCFILNAFIFNTNMFSTKLKILNFLHLLNLNICSQTYFFWEYSVFQKDHQSINFVSTEISFILKKSSLQFQRIIF